MAFVKKTWKDRISQYPNRRTINDGTTTKVVTVGRDEGTITEAGDAFNSSNMNDLENRIEAGLAEKPDREEVEDMVEGFFPLDEAGGAIASFNPGVMLPLRSCECQINAKQAGTGTPSPSNPRAISGYTACSVSVVGKNLFDESQITNASGWSESGGVYTGVVAQLYLYANNGFPKQPKYKENTQYTLSVYLNATNAVSRFRIYYTDSTYSDLALANTMVGTTLTLTTFQNKTVDKITFTYNTGGDLSISKIQLEEGTSASDFVAYTGNLYTVSFGQTIYGGRLIYDGQWSIEATHGYVDLGSLDWRIGYDVNRFITSDLVGIIQPPTNNDSIADVKCSIYSPISINNMIANAPNNTIAVATSSNLSILDNRYSSETDFKTFVSGKYLVYELETPLVYNLDPVVIKTLLNQNNIYHDCNGDIDVIYHKALTAKNIYFDNSGTTLTATNVEDAIKEVLSRI